MPNVVQSAGFCPSTVVDSFVGSLSSDIASGNLLVALAVLTKGPPKGSTTSNDIITDSVGLTWSLDVVAPFTSNGNRIKAWSAVVPSGGPVTVTVTPDRAPDVGALCLVEFSPDSGRVWSPTASVRVSDAEIGSTPGGTNTATTAPIVTGEDGLTAAIVAAMAPPTPDITPESSWTQLFEREVAGTEGKSINLIWKQTAAGTYVPTWDFAENHKWTCAGVAFRDSAP